MPLARSHETAWPQPEIHAGSAVYVPLHMLRNIWSQGRPRAVVYRYLNDYPSMSRTAIRVCSEHDAATELEVERAKLDVKIGKRSLKVAIFEHEQAQRKYGEAKIQTENMSLKTPIDGSIKEIDVETGELVNALGNVLRAVRIDPLWIEVPVPLTKTTHLRRGNTARVGFQDPDKISVDGNGRQDMKE